MSTITTLILVFSFFGMLGGVITFISFIGYLCSKKRKEKLARLESERTAKLAELEHQLKKVERLIENDTTPTVEVIKAVSTKKDLETEIKLLTEKK